MDEPPDDVAVKYHEKLQEYFEKALQPSPQKPPPYDALYADSKYADQHAGHHGEFSGQYVQVPTQEVCTKQLIDS